MKQWPSESNFMQIPFLHLPYTHDKSVNKTLHLNCTTTFSPWKENHNPNILHRPLFPSPVSTGLRFILYNDQYHSWCFCCCIRCHLRWQNLIDIAPSSQSSSDNLYNSSPTKTYPRPNHDTASSKWFHLLDAVVFILLVPLPLYSSTSVDPAY